MPVPGDAEWEVPHPRRPEPRRPPRAANGNYRDGYWTRETVEERKFLRSLIKGTLVDRP
jgi:hypothetical protein